MEKYIESKVDCTCERITFGSENTSGLLFIPKTHSKGTVVFSHGGGNDSLFPQFFLFTSLLQSGYGVFTFDLPGHGRHGEQLFSKEAFFAHGEHVLEWLAAHARFTRPWIAMGYSLGALQWLLLKQSWNEQLLAKVLLAAPLKLTLDFKALSTELMTLANPIFWQRARAYGVYGLLPALGPFKRKEFPIRLKNTKESYVTQFAALIEECTAKIPVAPRHAHELFVFGERDEFSGGRNAWDFFASHHPHATFIKIAQQNHFTLLLSGELEHTICHWLNRLSRSSKN